MAYMKVYKVTLSSTVMLASDLSEVTKVESIVFMPASNESDASRIAKEAFEDTGFKVSVEYSHDVYIHC